MDVQMFVAVKKPWITISLVATQEEATKVIAALREGGCAVYGPMAVKEPNAKVEDLPLVQVTHESDAEFDMEAFAQYVACSHLERIEGGTVGRSEGEPANQTVRSSLLVVLRAAGFPENTCKEVADELVSKTVKPTKP